jgi:hypothetical protein
MSINRNINLEEDTNGGAVCLPCCTNRVYTNYAAHYAFAGLSYTSIGLTVATLTIFGVSQTTQGSASNLLYTAGYFALGSVASIASTGLTFFCGTKPKSDITPDESNTLVNGIV